MAREPLKEATFSPQRIRSEWPGRLPRLLVLLWLLGVACTLAACSLRSSSPPVTEEVTGARPLIVAWRVGELPPELAGAFTAETGVPIRITPYGQPDGGERMVREGSVVDVTLVSNRAIPALTAADLLRPLDLHRLPNFKNISPSFRDLAFDPGNRYSVPYAWGVAGMVGRADLLVAPITSWDDLWDPAYCGRIVIWVAQQRTVIGAALKSLGYSANTEDLEELEAARAQLQKLKPCVRLVKGDNVIRYLPAAMRGELLLGVGNAHEAYSLRTLKLPFHYYLPQEGALLWGDSLVIPASAAQPEAAEQFIDFILRPEIAAELANLNYYQLANEAAVPYISPQLRNDPMLYPTTEQLRQAEILLPLSDAAGKVYDEIWQEMIAGPVE